MIGVDQMLALISAISASVGSLYGSFTVRLAFENRGLDAARCAASRSQFSLRLIAASGAIYGSNASGR